MPSPLTPSPLNLRGRKETHRGDEPLSPVQIILLKLFYVTGTYELIIKNEDSRTSYIGFIVGFEKVFFLLIAYF